MCTVLLFTQKLGFPAHMFENVSYFQGAVTALGTDSNKRHYKDQTPDKAQNIMRKKRSTFLYV